MVEKENEALRVFPWENSVGKLIEERKLEG
jgi:hypothetical protein